VRDSTVALLEDLGYSALAARNGMKALAQLRESKRIDILFTDVVIPQGMNGLTRSLEAAAVRPICCALYNRLRTKRHYSRRAA
jgi:CheY-like chemotaxis protein